MDKYSHRYTVVCTDMNKDYRFSPSAALLYFQESFARYMACLNMASFDLIKIHKTWIITEMSAEMMPVDTFWGDDIEVTIWVSEITPFRVYADYFIRKVDTDEMIVKGTSCWNLMSTDTHKLLETDTVARNITIRPEMMVETHRKVRFPKDGVLLKQVEHKVNRLDLDFNQHVNNRSYLSIAMLNTSDKFMSAFRTKTMIIHWMHESYLGENLCSALYEVGEMTYVNKITKEDGTVAAEIYSVWQPFDNQVDVTKVANRK